MTPFGILKCFFFPILRVIFFQRFALVFLLFGAKKLGGGDTGPPALPHATALCFPLNLERCSGETGCNYEITWYNNCDKLSWNCHIEKLTKKISGQNGRIQNMDPRSRDYPCGSPLILRVTNRKIFRRRREVTITLIWTI